MCFWFLLTRGKYNSNTKTKHSLFFEALASFSLLRKERGFCFPGLCQISRPSMSGWIGRRCWLIGEGNGERGKGVGVVGVKFLGKSETGS